MTSEVVVNFIKEVFSQIKCTDEELKTLGVFKEIVRRSIILKGPEWIAKVGNADQNWDNYLFLQFPTIEQQVTTLKELKTTLNSATVPTDEQMQKLPHRKLSLEEITDIDVSEVKKLRDQTSEKKIPYVTVICIVPESDLNPEKKMGMEHVVVYTNLFKTWTGYLVSSLMSAHKKIAGNTPLSMPMPRDIDTGVCKACNKRDVTAHCSQCHSVYYCNAECQRKHWNTEHRQFCDLMRAFKFQKSSLPED